MIKKKVFSYNDGVCEIYREKDSLLSTDFNIKRNARTLNDYNFVVESFYGVVTIREEDYNFAESMGKKITLKIRTPFILQIDSSYKIMIDSYMYDIIKVDADKRNKELYFYLEGGRKIEK